MGARPLQRVIDNEIKKELSRELLFGNLRNGGVLNIDCSEGSDNLELECIGDTVLVEI